LNVLVIDEEFPLPLNTGKRIRTFNLTNELAKNIDVSYLAYGDINSEAAEFLKSYDITPYAVKPVDLKQNGIRFYFKLFLNIFSPYPYIVTSHYTNRFASRLEQLVKENNFDTIIVEWTPYARYVRNITGCKKVIVAHNIESDIWKRYLENEKNYLKCLYIKLQYSKLIKFEKNAFKYVDGATAVSDKDSFFIKDLNLKYNIAVIENGVDTDYFHPMIDEINGSTLVFTGSMDWRPNQDAAVYFVDEIFPLLKREIPGIRAFFVGRNPPQHIINLGTQEGIVITGIVDDVRQYVAQGALYIVPLRVGGGSRLKILEAMAMKKPIVSTSIGAEGLDVTDRKDILLADTPEDFCSLCVKVLQEPELSEALVQNGFDLVHAKYKWELIGKKLLNYITNL